MVRTRPVIYAQTVTFNRHYDTINTIRHIVFVILSVMAGISSSIAVVNRADQGRAMKVSFF